MQRYVLLLVGVVISFVVSALLSAYGWQVFSLNFIPLLLGIAIWGIAQHESLWETVPVKSSPLIKMPLEVTLPWVGFRVWEVDKETLTLISPVKNKTPWPPDQIIRAACALGTPFHDDCSCGLYAHFSLKGIPSEFQTPYLLGNASVVGAVIGQGLAAEHPGEGFRAQRMRILAFLDRSDEYMEDSRSRQMSQIYNVPCLPVQHFLDYCHENGQLAS